MFRKHLQGIVDNVEGSIGGLIMGLDGIAVDTYLRDGNRVDVNTIGMEFSFILGQIKKAAEILAVGKVEETLIRAEQLVLLVRMINEDYFAAVCLEPEGNFGKCRFLVRIAVPKLLAEL